MLPTNKYIVFAAIFIGYAAYAYNRKAVSYSVTSLVAEGVNGDALGLILSSQNLAYTISKFFGGILFDNLSARYMFAGGLLMSGLSSLAFASTNVVYLYTILWFINGIAQGFGWPAIAKLLNNWFEPTEFGTYWSLASTSTNVIGTVGPMVAGYLLAVYGWRSSMLFAGFVSVAVGVLCLLLIKDAPKRKKPIKPVKPKKMFDSFWTLFTSKPVLCIAIQYFTVSGLKTCISDWGVLYLTETRGLDKMTADLFLSLFEFGGVVGGVASGFMTDFVIRHFYDNDENSAEGNPRMKVAAAFNAFSLPAYHMFRRYITPQTDLLTVASTAQILGSLTYGQITIYGIVASSAISKRKGGTAHAIVGLAANLGSVFAGLPFAYIARRFGWENMHFLYSTLMVLTLFLQISMTNIIYKVDLHDD